MIISEGGHWYAPDGTPVYEVPAKRGGMKPTTLREARTMGLFPSVTGIIREAANPGLENWKIEQAVLAAATLPRLADESVDQWADRVRLDAKVQSELARERGTAIHGAIERLFEGQQVDSDLLPFALPVVEWVDEEFPGYIREAEKAFSCPLGYGGKVDLVLRGDPTVVIDFKTTDNIDKARGYKSHLMQLCACANGVGADPESVRLVNLFVSSTEPGRLKPFEWPKEQHERGWRLFDSLLTHWKWDRNYFPGEK